MKRTFLVILLIAIAFPASFLFTDVFHSSAISVGQVIAKYDAENDAIKDETPVYSSIQFVGDIMLARHVEKLMDEFGAGYPLSLMTPVASSTYVVGNFEAAIPATHVPTPDFTFRFSVNPLYLQVLKTYGFTHLSLANNHAYDFGKESFEHTQKVLTDNGYTVMGSPVETVHAMPLMHIGDKTVQIIALNAVDNDYTNASTTAFLQSIVADYKIVYVHWGVEYSPTHTETQQALAHKLIDEGSVDAVIGHHPHVVQDIETYNGAPIFYSLGNFVFDQYFDDEVQEGLILELTFKESVAHFELLPVTSIHSRTAPRPMSAFEKKEFLEKLQKVSQKEISAMIESGAITADYGN